MIEIKNTQYQTAVEQSFRLIVTKGSHQGEYNIQEPDGFGEINIIVDINEEFFNVDNFILGESTKIKFLEYNDKKTFDLIQNVYEEQGGDGQIVFKWIMTKYGADKEIYDILGDDFELNLNKYKLSYEQSSRVIELEVKKREAQNKFLAREDITVNLFAEKNIDDHPIEKVKTDDIMLKTEVTERKSMYAMQGNQKGYWHDFPNMARLYGDHIGADGMLYLCPVFLASTTQTNDLPIYGFFGTTYYHYYETDHNHPNFGNDEEGVSGGSTFFYSHNKLENVQVSFSNWHFRANVWNNPRKVPFSLYLEVRNANGSISKSILLEESKADDDSDHVLHIHNKSVSVGKLTQGQSLKVGFKIKNRRGDEFMYIEEDNASISIHSFTINAGRKSRVVGLYDALYKVIENYSDGGLKLLKSEILNGKISTGAFLRSVANIFIAEEKINTSFKSLFYDSAAPLLALGFDVLDDFVIIDKVDNFFKSEEVIDLSHKDFIQDSLSIENDLDTSYNQLVFGTKKFSTKKKGDLLNFNTQVEYTTPIKSVKKKLDKTTDFIIDEYKVNDLLEDLTDTTNESDDDLVFLDTFVAQKYEDVSTYTNVKAEKDEEYLKLTIPTELDKTLFKADTYITILEGFGHVGRWLISRINRNSMWLKNPSISIRPSTGVYRFSYEINGIEKARNGMPIDGYDDIEGVTNRYTTINIEHNPKYQMKRWSKFFNAHLRKKSKTEKIKVAKYKNNGHVVIKKEIIHYGTPIIIPGVGEIAVIEKVETLLDRLNDDVEIAEDGFFVGKNIEINLVDVDFDEFYACYHQWRYGSNFKEKRGEALINNTYKNFVTDNRGLIKVRVLDEFIYIFPFGSGAFNYDKGYRELTIKGKIHKIERLERYKIFDHTFDDTFE